MSIQCQSKVSIEGIDRHLTADAFSTHYLKNLEKLAFKTTLVQVV